VARLSLESRQASWCSAYLRVEEEEEEDERATRVSALVDTRAVHLAQSSLREQVRAQRSWRGCSARCARTSSGSRIFQRFQTHRPVARARISIASEHYLLHRRKEPRRDKVQGERDSSARHPTTFVAFPRLESSEHVADLLLGGRHAAHAVAAGVLLVVAVQLGLLAVHARVVAGKEEAQDEAQGDGERRDDRVGDEGDL